MNVRIIKTVSTDKLILADTVKLITHIDKEDINYREANIVEDKYHRNWFFKSKGETYFTPPAAYIENGRIIFINGRHRCILLMCHLMNFPFLIGSIDSTHKSLEVINNICVTDLEENAIFSLPELEFCEFNPA